MFAGFDLGIGNLPRAAGFEIAQERVAHCRAVEARGRKAVEQDIARLQRAQVILPGLGNRAFLGQQRTGAVLEDDLAEFGVVDPVFPVAQVPDAASHYDRHRIRDSFGPHRVAQRLDPRIGILRLQRVFGVRQAVVAAGQPGIFIDHRAHQIGDLVVGALPQRPERAGRADDRQVVDVKPRGDFRKLVGHARTAGHPGDQTLGPFQHPFEHLLGPAHFPQQVDVERALAAGNVIGPADLFDRALDAIGDQFVVAFGPGCAEIGLIADVAVFVIEIGIDCADRTDPPGRSPGAGAGMIRNRHALAALDQWPDFPATIKDRLQPLETHCVPVFPFAVLHGLISRGSGRGPTASNEA